MKNIEMINNANRLNEFVAKDKVVPIALSFAISANINELTHKLEPYEVERKKLVKKKLEDKEEESDLLQELLDIDVDVEIRKVTKESLPEDLTTKDVIALSFMME